VETLAEVGQELGGALGLGLLVLVGVLGRQPDASLVVGSETARAALVGLALGLGC
jgi:hypothetical protein